MFRSPTILFFLQTLINENSHEEDGRISFVIDGAGVVVAHPDAQQIEEQYNYKDLVKTVSAKDASGNQLKDESGNIITEQQPITVSDDFKQMIMQVMAGNSGSGKVLYNGAQRIRDICEKAEGLSIEVTDSLAEELVSVQNDVQSLTTVSGEMEQEMSKFKLRN